MKLSLTAIEEARLAAFMRLCVAYTVHPFRRVFQMTWTEEAGEARSHKAVTKIPTVLEYEEYVSPSGGHVRSWGFEASRNSESYVGREALRIVEWFKPYLDSDYLIPACQSASAFLPKSESEVRRWYVDYLRRLYSRVQAEIIEKLKERHWNTLHIEFRFTWPTTWTAAAIKSFRDCILQAGYESGGQYHRVHLKLSEAQAAALDVARRMRGEVVEGDTVMVCDVGGGTTDIAVVKASTGINGQICFGVDWSCPGKAVGTTDIDAAFEAFVERRLSVIPLFSFDKKTVARHMRESSGWNRIKRAVPEQEVHSIAVPVAVPDNDDAGVNNGSMTVTRDDRKEIFQEPLAQVQRMILDAMQEYKQPLSYLVGCGGYFYLEIARQEFENILLDSPLYLRHCSATKVKVASEPGRELAVARGGCLPDPYRPGLDSIGLVCGDHIYEQASVSKIEWVDCKSMARSGAQVAVLPLTDAATAGTFTFNFRHSPKAQYSYLTLVTLSTPSRDQVEGTDRPLCQLRVEKRHIKRSWRRSKALLQLSWKKSRCGISLELMVGKSSIPFDVRQREVSSAPRVILPEGTVDISDAQWS
ncbi:MAG: hypothetical protein Q9187_004284 [Circinaria calcarea]